MRVAYAQDSVLNPDGAIPSPQPGVPVAADPKNPLRAALQKNDVRNWNWTPAAPVMMCGGHNDPMVFYAVNTGVMSVYWASLIDDGTNTKPVHIMDVDPGPPLASGGIATQAGTIAATIMASSPAGTAPAQIVANVQKAIAAQYLSYIDPATGLPNSPQGVMAAGVANIAAQAVAQYLAQGVTSPSDMATNVANAVVSYYHGTLTAAACQIVTQQFFANF
jgi:hypothetical protein